MPKKVFLSLKYPQLAIDMLTQAGFDITINESNNLIPQDELINICQEYDALLSTGSNKIDAHFLKSCQHLDVISQFAVGYDNIDVQAAKQFGIVIGNAPGAMTEATADVAFGLMIMVSRKMVYMHKTIEKGQWEHFVPTANLGFELDGKTLGVFGLGTIGMVMAKRCKAAYGMDIIYHNRSRNQAAEDTLNAKYVSFDELLAQSDVLSVHSNLTEETKGVFGKDAFAKMKNSTVFINTARGGIHNETDLIEALKNGSIWGAGLDVTNPEPMQPNNPLLQMENVAVLPHIGSSTVEARNEMARMSAQNIIDFYKTGKIPHPVT
ncbi:D-glycerate dehydrogenase [Muricauda sp. CAU 1633]|uniref:2-hydroxyacid dehydrogenase n=1 Tax=Allomuricauda sp. CAU 1633 TaxID=2816036 RepID=UPI001A8CB5E9|nr:D-glycerate dehydrogenase [Muricauda sp. CAU 1633]MBO0322412.1 D-glycerate dehydrogenase [Muricauda sp. CAU 1633]